MRQLLPPSPTPSQLSSVWLLLYISHSPSTLMLFCLWYCSILSCSEKREDLPEYLCLYALDFFDFLWKYQYKNVSSAKTIWWNKKIPTVQQTLIIFLSNEINYKFLLKKFCFIKNPTDTAALIALAIFNCLFKEEPPVKSLRCIFVLS